MVRTSIAILALAGSALAGEYAVLGSGFRIHVDRHQSDGNVVRLYSGGGVTELLDGGGVTSSAARACPPAIKMVVVHAASAAAIRTSRCR